MGEIVISQFISIDGVVEDPAGGEGYVHGGWRGEITGRGAVDDAKLLEAVRAEALLLGRRTYEFLAARWPSREGELAERLNALPKYVVSSTLEDPAWNNSRVLRGDVVPSVSTLKEEISGEIVVYGSVRLARTLTEHDLVDELRLMIHPLLLGPGRRLFSETGRKHVMHLADSQLVGDDVALLVYRRTA